MTGNYDLALVLMSYVIAALASFTALELAGRVASATRWRPLWLIGGSLAMGSGIWSMHFVGMSAFSLPVPITYDLWLTLYSWIAAVLVSALALLTIARARLTVASVLTAAVLMGAGICAMHYTGMYAMQMQPPIAYDPLLFAGSAAIAVLASAAALIIAFQLRTVRSWRDVLMRVGAALIMGFAIVGMHYTGMAAAQFADGAYCAPGNALAGNWVTGPTLVAMLLFLPLALAMAFGIANARMLADQERRRRERQDWATAHAYIDDETQLPNRSAIIRTLMAAMHGAERQPFALVTVHVIAARTSNGRAVSELRTVLPALVARLRLLFPEHDALARLTVTQFAGLLRPAGRDRLEADFLPRLRQAFGEPLRHGGEAYTIEVEYGTSVFPADGRSAQMLLVNSGRRMRPLPPSRPPLVPPLAAVPA